MDIETILNDAILSYHITFYHQPHKYKLHTLACLQHDATTVAVLIATQHEAHTES